MLFVSIVVYYEEMLISFRRSGEVCLFCCAADVATVMEIDHDARQVFTEIIRVLPTPPDISLLRPSEEAVAARITSPIVTTYIDTEKIAFERFSCYSK